MTEQERPEQTEREAQHPVGKELLDANSKSAIMSAIHNLDKNNPDHYTKDGAPRTEVLAAMCGFKVTRADVIEVWGDQSEPTQASPAPSRTEIRDDPIACMELFEQAMAGSRNAVLHQLYNAWLRDKPQAIELAERLKVRGQY